VEPAVQKDERCTTRAAHLVIVGDPVDGDVGDLAGAVTEDDELAMGSIFFLDVLVVGAVEGGVAADDGTEPAEIDRAKMLPATRRVLT